MLDEIWNVGSMRTTNVTGDAVIGKKPEMNKLPSISERSREEDVSRNEPQRDSHPPPQQGLPQSGPPIPKVNSPYSQQPMVGLPTYQPVPKSYLPGSQPNYSPQSIHSNVQGYDSMIGYNSSNQQAPISAKPPVYPTSPVQIVSGFDRTSDSKPIQTGQHPPAPHPIGGYQSPTTNILAGLPGTTSAPVRISSGPQPTYDPIANSVPRVSNLVAQNLIPSQPDKTTSVFMPDYKPVPQNISPDKNVISRESTFKSDKDNSILNQSLNTSIRLKKGAIKGLDSSIMKAAGGSQGKKDADDEESMIELNMDENGFLVDDKGFPILNDKGEPIKLSDEQLEQLKENGLYEEEILEGQG